jgi:DNA polymerase-3 subunit chi
MTEVLFYHLERASLEGVLPGLLEKTLERGWRACVRAGSRERVERLDAHLWTYRDESFLPHSAGGGKGGKAARQPIWLTDGEDAPNDPQILFLVDNAKANADAIGGLDRCVMIFDGRDEEAVADARVFWKAAKDSGNDATYWKQSAQGRWEKQG